ncbi:hypothetical protein BDZ94DRAFT_1264450 [Collybia nuda]|uniref:Uncharacterized protein n=1 Tax=Collybia nuda TaxID=64659 RepID=A0A9P5Y2L9_9AGAR|nr:hypothetical protein BDZ94DRAFT_1264450 [Collybia nuda]
MHFVPLISSLLLALTAQAMIIERGDEPVATAERIVHNIINEAPYLVDTKTTVTWTPGPTPPA